MSYRPATEADLPAIEQALRTLKYHADKYPFVASTSVDKATASLRGLLPHGLYIVDGYLVAVDTFSPWYSDDKILQEWLVLKLYQGGSTASIPPMLRELAEQLECSVILTGDSSPVQLMAKTYEAAGYYKLTQSFCTKV